MLTLRLPAAPKWAIAITIVYCGIGLGVFSCSSSRYSSAPICLEADGTLTASDSIVINMFDLKAVLGTTDALQREKLLAAVRESMPIDPWREATCLVTVEADCPIWMMTLLFELLRKPEREADNRVAFRVSGSPIAADFILHDLPEDGGAYECYHLHLRSAPQQGAMQLGGYYGPAKKLIHMKAGGQHGFPSFFLRTETVYQFPFGSSRTPVLVYAERSEKIADVLSMLKHLGLGAQSRITLFSMAFASE